MATVQELVKARKLLRFIPGLEPGEQEFRTMYGTPKLAKWVEDDLPTLNSQHNLDLTPQQQLEARLIQYALGRPLTYRWHFRPIKHHGDGVWEIKTADIRLFGWFYQKDQFVGVLGDQAWRVKEFKLVRGYTLEVMTFREALDLDEPKFVPGKEPTDVVSNFIAPLQASGSQICGERQ